MQNKKQLFIPVGYCPSCGRSIIYSRNPINKKNIIVCRADDSYTGNTVLCAKCKTMLAVMKSAPR